MKNLFGNIRFYVLVCSFAISLLIFLYIFSSTLGTLRIIRLTQFYGFTAVFFLYLTLLVTPITRYFRFIPYRGQIVKARRALGVSVFYFAILHSTIAFFGQLGGFEGLPFLDTKYLLAVVIGLINILILTVMASTSFDYMEERLTHKVWKFIHRFVYLVGILIIIHVLIIGTHFANLTGVIPKIFFSLIALLLVLEAKRFDDFLSEKLKKTFSFGPTILITVSLLTYFLGTYIFSSNPVASLGVHSQHLLQAKQGNNTKLNVSMSIQNSNINFQIFNATNGEQVKDFAVNQEKVMHLIIVSDDLTYFDHVHPDLKDGIFSINYKLPKGGTYRLYIDFQPKGMSEQVFAFKVGSSKEKPQILKSFDMASIQNNIKATLILPKNLNSKDLSTGKELVVFQFSDAKTGEDIKNIGTYLGAFGHLIMINTDTYQYVHVHPNLTYTPIDGEETGPKVSFSPLGIYGNIEPGIYKLFGQFKINGKLQTFTFFVKVN